VERDLSLVGIMDARKEEERHIQISRQNIIIIIIIIIIIQPLLNACEEIANNDLVEKNNSYTVCPQSPFGVLKNCGAQTN
jgi:hypothetical protein